MSSRNCLFCKIIRGEEPSQIFYNDHGVLVLTDIRPAAEYHYLAIPKEHIESVQNLKTKHIEMLRNLKKAGEAVLNAHMIEKSHCVTRVLPSTNGLTTDLVPLEPIQAIFGFHVPPYNSQNHLHMHIVAPADTLTVESRERVLGTNCFRFISINKQLHQLEQRKELRKIKKAVKKPKPSSSCARPVRLFP